MKQPKTIIYIMSNQRSGSTLMENILSKSKEIVSIGESYLMSGYIHKTGPGGAWDWNCSCGASLDVCEFWTKVYKQLNLTNAKEITNTKINLPKGNNKAYQKELNKRTVDLVNRIYSAVFDISKCDIIVDSSKEPFYGYALYNETPFRFKILYLRRDLRAVSISRKKWRKKYQKEDLGLFKLLISNFLHRLNSWFLLRKVNKADVMRLNYEDFFKNPQETLNEMSSFFTFSEFNVPESMELNDDHTIAGTPNRFQKRPIKYDDNWQQVAKSYPIFNFLGVVLNKIV